MASSIPSSVASSYLTEKMIYLIPNLKTYFYGSFAGDISEMIFYSKQYCLQIDIFSVPFYDIQYHF